jgi:hypothetical protein
VPQLLGQALDIFSFHDGLVQNPHSLILAHESFSPPEVRPDVELSKQGGALLASLTQARM